MKHSIIVLLTIDALVLFLFVTGAVPGIWLIFGAYFGLIVIAINRRMRRRGLLRKRFYWL